MTMLIKAEAAAFVARPFGEPARPGRPEPAPARKPTAEDERLERLEKEIAELRQLLAAAQEEVGKAELRGNEAGRREVEETARRGDDRRLEAIRKSAAAALEQWKTRMSGLEKLAPLIAHSALAKLFEEPRDHADLVTGMIALQIDRLGRALVAVHVSPQDFAGSEALAALQERLGRSELALACDPALGAGESRIDLRLGHVDVSVEDQWAQLSALLLELAEEQPA